MKLRDRDRIVGLLITLVESRRQALKLGKVASHCQVELRGSGLRASSSEVDYVITRYSRLTARWRRRG